MFSFRYLHSVIKKYDGIEQGSSSLWSSRLIKGYGVLPEKAEHNKHSSRDFTFNYSSKQIAIARKFRTSFYERLFTPEEFFFALKYCPVIMDIEIFSSINSDREGVITLPDEEDEKEEVDHTG